MNPEERDLGRVAALSDGMFAVIITIMVLALRPPDRYDVHALLDLWPDITSYAVSYLFIAVVWLNHHYVFAYGRRLTDVLAWSNFANLFAISLIPIPPIPCTSSSSSERVMPFGVHADLVVNNPPLFGYIHCVIPC